MKTKVVFILLALTIPTSAQTAKSESDQLMENAIDLLYNCYQREVLRAFKPKSDELSVANAMLAACSKEMEISGVSLYSTLVARGRTPEDARKVMLDIIRGGAAKIVHAIFDAQKDQKQKSP
jgi:hypothetical protein